MTESTRRAVDPARPEDVLRPLLVRGGRIKLPGPTRVSAAAGGAIAGLGRAALSSPRQAAGTAQTWWMTRRPARGLPATGAPARELAVDRLGRRRARTTPLALRSDKAYSSRAHRALLRHRGITAVIPEPDDQKRNRARRGSRGGRPVGFDAADYKNRNVVERGFNLLKGWRGLATPLRL
ncbi:hypothetical protein PHK61_31520 [Actinomycetospora lutea]|uniref:transposase n=1 Tax=Actinomycetospora lutea TaxID=663604 RepID=UPI0023653890|nr:transposase [Actinomycetospora lutea]MDD7942946.1 hypothetical protein [Actinomycetospora lutea]